MSANWLMGPFRFLRTLDWYDGPLYFTAEAGGVRFRGLFVDSEPGTKAVRRPDGGTFVPTHRVFAFAEERHAATMREFFSGDVYLVCEAAPDGAIMAAAPTRLPPCMLPDPGDPLEQLCDRCGTPLPEPDDGDPECSCPVAPRPSAPI